MSEYTGYYFLSLGLICLGLGYLGGLLGAGLIIYVIIWAISSSCERIIQYSGGDINQIAWHCQVFFPRLIESFTP